MLFSSLMHVPKMFNVPLLPPTEIYKLPHQGRRAKSIPTHHNLSERTAVCFGFTTMAGRYVFLQSGLLCPPNSAPKHLARGQRLTDVTQFSVISTPMECTYARSNCQHLNLTTSDKCKFGTRYASLLPYLHPHVSRSFAIQYMKPILK